MAFHWRIRHKLMLGFGLVVGIIALILGGTLYGLISYRATMKSIESKLAELKEAEAFKVAVNGLSNLSAPAGDSETGNVVSKLLEKVKDAEEALDSYEEKLQDTLTHGRDPDKGFQERGLVEAIRGGLAGLRAAADEFPTPRAFSPGKGGSLLEDPGIKEAVSRLARDSSDLRFAIYDDLDRRNKDARGYNRTSMWIVISTSVLGVVLLASWVRFFYGWVFYPIRDLEEGAGRLAQGDFEHRIEVHSGDEMEDLAAAFNDMTRRLREMYRDLARQVNERSRQLVRSERLASVGFLAAGVAHEINNPLASIAFCSEALDQRLTSLLNSLASTPGIESKHLGKAIPADLDKDTEVITKYLKMIQEEAFRCKKITQRLLEFSRGGERHREPTDLAKLIQDVRDMVQLLQNCKGKHIVFEPEGQLVAWVNAQEIKSVVLNLVVNALDSMDDGGTLAITLVQRDHMAEMVFADSGCGMSAEILENIFEPFFTRSRTGKGTGLGLSISHRVISQHGGEIEAVSPGLKQGSTFTVRLPLQPAGPFKEETLGHAAA